MATKLHYSTKKSQLILIKSVSSFLHPHPHACEFFVDYREIVKNRVKNGLKTALSRGVYISCLKLILFVESDTTNKPPYTEMYNHGGYDFAKQFYENAYKAAVSEIAELQEAHAEESEKLDKTKERIQKQKLDLKRIDEIEDKPTLIGNKVTVDKDDFDVVITAAKKIMFP